MSKFSRGDHVRIKGFREIIPANTCDCTSEKHHRAGYYFNISRETIQKHSVGSDFYVIEKRSDYAGQEAYHVKLPGDRSRLWFNRNLYWAAEMLESIEQDEEDSTEMSDITDETLMSFLMI